MIKRWQIGFQEAVTPIMEAISELHNLLLIIITIIAILVAGLILYVVIRYHNQRNPVPSKTSHNTLLEVIWTGIPAIIVLILLIPSLKTLYFVDQVPVSEMTITVIGHPWYWSYEYPDHENISFDSYLIPESNLKPGDLRLLAVDNPLVVPVGTTIRVISTSVDVIHSWAVPSLGIKKDTVPGRLNEFWIHVNKEGVYYGQCSELCGPGHGYMPIMVRVLSKDAFQEWIKISKTKFS